MPVFQKNSRRTFLKNTVKGAAVIAISTGMSEFLSSCGGSKKAVKAANLFATGIDQSPLPYAYAALENVIDAQTMEIHYSKHAAAYSKSLKEAIAAEAVPAGTSLEEILAGITKYSAKMRNNAGGHYNHEMFWKCMRPKSEDNKPTNNLLQAIETEYGSFAQFKNTFSQAGKAVFGSGWVWLLMNDSKKLSIGTTANQDNPLMENSQYKGFPLLCLDVWEHAYYLKYQNKRADYIDNWWNVVNWNYVQSRFEKA